MKLEYYKEYSHALKRDMEFKTYGDKGLPCLVFPAQDGRFFDFENFGMIDAVKSYVEEGRIQLFCCDSNDAETWSDKEGDPRCRMERHERYYQYIVDELVPRIRKINNVFEDRDESQGIMTCGCSLGAYHALNFLLRRPDIFKKVIGLSGLYNPRHFIENYHDELLIRNSPVECLLNIDEENLDIYRGIEIVLCCGKGAWELEMEKSLYEMENIFKQLQIDAWIDVWGYDVSHDWSWWKKQLDYFLQFMV